MFTGLIQGVGSLHAREAHGGDQRLAIGWGDLAHADAALGESIAVNGVCLTVVACDDLQFMVDVSTETLALTTLGTLAEQAPVNLERALRADERLGGHLLSGHVDDIGRVLSITPDARAQRWRFAAPRALLGYIAAKGSIAVDGVSLTVNAVHDHAADAEAGCGAFEVALIPHTVSRTRFSVTRAGDAVNLEVDMLARYVERLLSVRGGA